MANIPSHEHLMDAFLAHSIRHNYQDPNDGPRQFIIETNDDIKFDVWAQVKEIEPRITYEILSWRSMNWNDRPTNFPNEEL